MNAVKDKITALVDEELEAANAIYPPFRSTHEGYAVLLEEVEEAREDIERINMNTEGIWYAVRGDSEVMAYRSAATLEKNAIHLAAEAIQVAAMARKFQAIGKDMSAPGMEVE